MTPGGAGRAGKAPLEQLDLQLADGVTKQDTTVRTFSSSVLPFEQLDAPLGGIVWGRGGGARPRPVLSVHNSGLRLRSGLTFSFGLLRDAARNFERRSTSHF